MDSWPVLLPHRECRSGSILDQVNRGHLGSFPRELFEIDLHILMKLRPLFAQMSRIGLDQQNHG